MIVSEFSPNSVVIANSLLVAIPLKLVIVKKYEDGVIAFILPWYVWFYPFDSFISWCCADDLFWGDDDAPCFGAGG